MKPKKTTEVSKTKPLQPKIITKEVFGDGKSQSYMSAWYDHDNEENHL